MGLFAPPKNPVKGKILQKKIIKFNTLPIFLNGIYKKEGK